MAQVLSGRDVAASINVQVLEESLRLQAAGDVQLLPEARDGA